MSFSCMVRDSEFSVLSYLVAAGREDQDVESKVVSSSLRKLEDSWEEVRWVLYL